jgi:hypothetical protein
MNRAALFAVFLPVCTAWLQAQTIEKQSPNAFVLQATCPVSMHALQGSGGGLVTVHGEKQVSGPSQRIYLVLANDREQRITRATVRVEGLSPKNRIARTNATQSLTSDLTRTLDVSFTPGDHNQVAAEMVLPGFSSITSIELQSISYQDGSTWSVPGLRGCRVTPDPFMLVADK